MGGACHLSSFVGRATGDGFCYCCLQRSVLTSSPNTKASRHLQVKPSAYVNGRVFCTSAGKSQETACFLSLSVCRSFHWSRLARLQQQAQCVQPPSVTNGHRWAKRLQVSLLGS